MTIEDRRMADLALRGEGATISTSRRLRSIFYKKRQNTLFEVGRWMFDVGRSSVSFLNHSGHRIGRDAGKSIIVDMVVDLVNRY